MKKLIWPIRLVAFVIFLFLITRGKMMLWLGIYGITVVLAIFFGRIYCGYLCPMNTTMTLAEKISKALGIQRDSIPKFLKSELLPWVFLLLSLLIMVASKKVLQKNIPILIIWIIVSFLITLIFKPELFHVYICPFTTFQKLTGSRAIYSEKVTAEDCIGCNKCVKECPGYAITMVDKKAIIGSKNCLQCKRCEDVCPTDAIDYGRIIK